MKSYIVASCNTDGGDIFVEYVGKTIEGAKEYMRSAVLFLLDQFIENGYGESRDDFDYYIGVNDADAYCNGCTYYYQVCTVDHDKAV